MDANVYVEWESDGLRFDGVAGDRRTAIDGNGREGPSPVSLLLESLAGCAGSDVVEILRKGRQELRELRVVAEGWRREEPPRYFRRLRVRFLVRGDVDPKAAERAARLSFETYCSVFHTLRKDLELEWEVELRD